MHVRRQTIFRDFPWFYSILPLFYSIFPWFYSIQHVQIFRGPLAPGHCPINLELDVEVFCTECMMLKPVESWNLPPRPRNNKRGRREMRTCWTFGCLQFLGTRFVTWFMTCWMRSHSRKLERKEAKCHLSKKPSCYLRLRRFPARRNGFRKSAGPYMNLSWRLPIGNPYIPHF